RLPNRALFMTRLERTLALARRDADHVAVLMVDLDRFKRVNDTNGHDAGDDLLRQVAARLTAAVRANDMVARLGGDEFAILAVGATTPAAAQRVCDKLHAAVLEPFTLPDGSSVSVGASVGFAISPREGDT